MSYPPAPPAPRHRQELGVDAQLNEDLLITRQLMAEVNKVFLN